MLYESVYRIRARWFSYDGTSTCGHCPWSQSLLKRLVTARLDAYPDGLARVDVQLLGVHVRGLHAAGHGFPCALLLFDVVDVDVAVTGDRVHLFLPLGGSLSFMV
jgi:hypothetical protein